MAENGGSANGFVWYEMMTADTDAAAEFYAAVMGWSAQDSGTPGMNYTLFKSGDGRDVAGMMALPDQVKAAGVPPHWAGYVHVDDPDATAAAFKAAGGGVLADPQDVPGVGRFAMLADPQGAAIGVIRFEGPAEANTGVSDPSGCPWRELHSTDGEAGYEFYTGVFNWTGAGEMESPAGPYRMYRAGGEDMAGGMMTKMHDGPPHWLYYFSVPALDAAVAAAKSRGATVLTEAMEVPGGSWIANLIDPQGAAFSLNAPKR